MVRKVRAALGKAGEDLFVPKVDPRLVPDYYTIIKNPMWIGEIERRLAQRQYQAPQEFADDFRLVWSNCKIYNKKGDPFCKLGEVGETVFNTAWAGSGLCGDERSKRATAGVAAPKYEPEVFEPPIKPKPGHSKQRAPKGSKVRPACMPACVCGSHACVRVHVCVCMHVCAAARGPPCVHPA